MLRDVRAGAALVMAWSFPADIVIIRVLLVTERELNFSLAGAAMTTTTVEREIKLRFASAEEARAAVVAAGATPLLGRRLQEDSLLDTADEQLRRRRCVLRVRVENGKSRLTFKGPVQPSVLDLREELETVVGDGEALLRVFEELGL